MFFCENATLPKTEGFGTDTERHSLLYRAIYLQGIVNGLLLKGVENSGIF